MFPPGDPGIHAGMFGPVGTARAIDGGYVFSGNYSFGSGTADATWIGAGATEEKDGEPVVTAAGLPSLLVGFFPSDAVEPRGNWDVMGLAGTGSYDYAVDSLTVDAGFTFRLLEAVATRAARCIASGSSGSSHRVTRGSRWVWGREHLPKCSLLPTANSAWAASKLSARNSCSNMTSRCTTRAMRAARAYVYDAFGAAEATVLAGDDCTLVQQQRLRQATTYATRVAADAARFAYTWAGTEALRNPSVAAALLPRHPRGHAAHLRRQQHADRYTQALLATPPADRCVTPSFESRESAAPQVAEMVRAPFNSSLVRAMSAPNSMVRPASRSASRSSPASMPSA